MGGCTRTQHGVRSSGMRHGGGERKERRNREFRMRSLLWEPLKLQWGATAMLLHSVKMSLAGPLCPPTAHWNLSHLPSHTTRCCGQLAGPPRHLAVLNSCQAHDGRGTAQLGQQHSTAVPWGAEPCRRQWSWSGMRMSPIAAGRRQRQGIGTSRRDTCPACRMRRRKGCCS